MSKKTKKGTIATAKKYANYLLYEVTGGNLGDRPEKEFKGGSATFGEKRGLLDSLIKIAALEKSGDPNEEETSGLDAIKKEIAKRNKSDGGRENWGAGDTGGEAESGTDDPAGASGDDRG